MTYNQEREKELGQVRKNSQKSDSEIIDDSEALYYRAGASFELFLHGIKAAVPHRENINKIYRFVGYYSSFMGTCIEQHIKSLLTLQRIDYQYSHVYQDLYEELPDDVKAKIETAYRETIENYPLERETISRENFTESFSIIAGEQDRMSNFEDLLEFLSTDVRLEQKRFSPYDDENYVKGEFFHTFFRNLDQIVKKEIEDFKQLVLEP